MDDGIEHDDECEYASEACGCESRAKLRKEIADLKSMIKEFLDVVDGELCPGCGYSFGHRLKRLLKERHS